MNPQTFECVLESTPDGKGFFIVPPFNVLELFGERGRLPVKVSINTLVFRSSLFPRGDGTHYLVLNKPTRQAASINLGDRFTVTLEQDFEPRKVNIPKDVSTALGTDFTAQEQFFNLSYTKQKESLDWIAEAKKNDTRQRRIEKMMRDLTKGLEEK
ncbi:MAG: DUF1905 domain-containing protein [Anaerolineaceae bacterium]|nr:DUF1905 domain-containing protein [Anaerolineaceae bacterium]